MNYAKIIKTLAGIFILRHFIKHELDKRRARKIRRTGVARLRRQK